ncbi:MAG: PilZ domain-containing protein [Candidatus Omnitrophota bacterium]
METGFSPDKRQDLRLEERLPARLRLAKNSEAVLEAKTGNISLSGVLLDLDSKQKNLGKKVWLEMVSSPFGSVITTNAEVVWHNAVEGGASRVGLRFLDLNDTKKEEILKLLLERLMPSKEDRLIFKAPDRRLSEKESRSLEILDLLRRQGPVSISYVSQAIGVNVVTTTNYLKDFLKKGIIVESGEDISSGGRRPNLIKFNPGLGYVIGLEANQKENFVLGILTDLSSKGVARIREEFAPGSNLAQRIAELILRLIKICHLEREKILGIGLAGTGLSDLDFLREYLEQKTGLPVLAKHSFQVGVFAEKWLNSDLAAIDDLVYLDSPEHCSMIIGGRLYAGHSQEAGWVHAPHSDFKEILFCLISLLNPQAVVVSQELVECREEFLNSFREEMRRVLGGMNKLPTIIASTMGEDTAVAAMASLVIREIFTQI